MRSLPAGVIVVIILAGGCRDSEPELGPRIGPAQLAASTYTLESVNGQALPVHLVTRVDGCVETLVGARLEFSSQGGWALVNSVQSGCTAAGRAVTTLERNLYGQWSHPASGGGITMGTAGTGRRARFQAGGRQIEVDLPADSASFWSPVRLVLSRDR